MPGIMPRATSRGALSRPGVHFGGEVCEARMQALAYWKAVTADRSEFLERPVGLLAESSLR